MDTNTKPTSFTEYLRRGFTPLLLLYVFFCIPLALAIYTPVSYQLNCHWNPRCDRMGEAKTQQSISEITRFFRHQEELPHPPWSTKEIIHLTEVRDIYDYVYLIFAAICLLLILDVFFTAQARSRYHRYAKNCLWLSGGLVIFSLLLIPFFRQFWMDVFHPLLFDNELWRTNRNDISWYLMPRTFFLRIIIVLFSTVLLFNLLLLALTRQGTKTHKQSNT